MSDTSSQKRNEKEGLGPSLPDLIDNLLRNAISDHATDIHIDRLEGVSVVRFRIDGIIHEKEVLAADESQRLINEIKVVSGLDIDKKLVPQEGHIEFWDKDIKRDIRVTIIPTGYKEAAHLRIIAGPPEKWDIEALGFSNEDEQKIKKALQSPYGLILIAGQTGSGKTTTLYTLASLLDLRSSVGASIEDPVEFNLLCLRQLQVDEDRGISMAEGLKSILRTDPDIIIVGEIRDQQSAVTAAEAALAGRLVLATIHAKSIVEAVESLHYMSVPSYVLGSIIHLIIGQQLVRRLCGKCSKSKRANKGEKAFFTDAGMKPPRKIYSPAGCPECDSVGYKGQIGIFETLVADDDVKHAISEDFDREELQKLFLEKGMTPKLCDGLQKVKDGSTSLKEISRVFWLGVDTT